MKRITLPLFFCLTTILLTAQNKLYFGLAPSYTYAHFANGTTNLPAFDDGAVPYGKTNIKINNAYSNQDGVWGVGKVELNLARKFAYMLMFEHYFTKHHSILTGLEYGSRRFEVLADDIPPFGGTFLKANRSFRSMGIPVIYQYSALISKNWQFQTHLGGSINQSHSTEQDVYNYFVNKSQKIFPLAIAGIGIQKRITHSFSLKGAITYHHGFFNILDEVYRESFGNRQYHNAAVQSNGSHIKFSLFIELIDFSKAIE
jgi:hypothetical protein